MTDTTVVGLVYQLEGVAALAASYEESEREQQLVCGCDTTALAAAIDALDDARKVANEAAQAAYVYASCDDGDAALEAAHAALDAAFAAAKVAHAIDDAAYEADCANK